MTVTAGSSKYGHNSVSPYGVDWTATPIAPELLFVTAPEAAPDGGKATTPDSWAASKSGTWAVGANWSTGAAPTASNDATIAVAGKYTVTIAAPATANSLTVNDSTATVLDNSTLSLAGSLALTAGTFTLGSSGSVVGGTLSAGTGGVYTFAGGTLSGVVYQGALALTQQSASLTIDASDTFAGSVTESISITGADANLYYDGNGTLDNAAISIGANNGSYADLYGNGGTLTLGSHASIVQSGTTAYLGVFSSETFITQGAITAAVKNGSFTIEGSSLANAGTIAISNGDDLTVSLSSMVNTGVISATGSNTVLSLYSGNGTLTNSGTISASGNNSTLTLNASNGQLTNTGSIGVSAGATLTLAGNGTFTQGGTVTLGAGTAANFGGTLSIAALSSVVDNGAAIAITGDLLNTGGTLSVGTGSTFGAVSLSGTVTGGTIVDGGGGIVATGGTLSGVVYQGALALTQQNASLTIDASDTFAGSATESISITGSYSDLYYAGNGTLDNAAISLGANNGSYANLNGSGGTLTFGSHASIVQAGTTAYLGLYSSETFINQGVITAAVKNGNFTLGGSGLTNSGTMAVSNGDALNISLNGSITNTGMISATGSNTMLSLYVVNGTLTNSGTISASGNNSTLTLNASNGQLTNTGSIGVSAGATLTLAGNGTFTQGGTVTLGAGTAANFGGTLSIAALSSVVDSGAAIAITGDLLNTGGTMSVGTGSTFGAVSLSGTVTGGTIVDSGGGIVATGGTLSGVVYQGALALTHQNASLTIDASDTFAGSATESISITGSYSDLYYDGNGTLDNVAISLGANNGYYANLTGNGGTLTFGSHSSIVQAGATAYLGVFSSETFITQGAITAAVKNGGFTIEGSSLANAGTIAISNGDDLTVSLSSMVNTGVISATGSNTVLSLYSGNGTLTNSGTISASGNNSTLTLNASNGQLTNTGSIGVSAGATLTLAGNGTFTQGGTVTLGAGTAANFGGTLSIAALSSVVDNGAAIAITGDLLNTGGTLSVGTGSTFGAVSLSGTVTGGTIVDSGGGIVATGGTLSGVVYQGALALTQQSASLTIDASDTFAGSVTESISITGADANLYYDGNGTLDNVAISLGANNGSYANLTGNGGTLTFGSHSSIVQAGATAYLGVFSSDTFITQGAITAAVKNGGFTVQGSSLANAGTIAVSNGDDLTVSMSGSITNTGVISASGNNTSLNLYSANGTLTNSGTISASGSSTVLTVGNSNDQVTNTGSIAVSSGATLNLTGTLTNTTLKGGTLSGSYEVDGNALLQLANNEFISAIAGTVTLSGAGSTIQSSNGTTQVTIDTKLATINAGAKLNLLAGRSFNAKQAFVDSGLLTLGGGTLTETSLAVASTGTISGFGTLANAVADAGTIAASGGTLTLAGAVTGAGALQIGAGAVLEAGAASSASETVTFGGTGATLKVDAAASFASPLAGFAAGNIIDLAKTTITAVSSTGTLLLATTASASDTFTLTAPLANTHLALTSDAAGGTDITAYALAQAATHTPEPVAFGNHHVGDTVGTALTLTNTTAANGYAEALDAGLAGATAGITAAGSFTGLAAGQSNATSLTVGLNTSAAGSIAGTATITLASDGTGIDGFGQTALGTQTVNVTGAVYNYAAASVAGAGTVALANTHVGQAVTGTLAVTNAAPAGAYSEALDATLGAASAGFSASGAFTGLAAGGTNTGSLLVGTTAAAAGAYTGTATLALTSDGTGIDGLGTTALPGQQVTITGAAYAYAAATLAGTAINLGVVHVGSTANQALTLTNTAPGGGYSEALDATFGSTTGAATTSGSVTGLLAGGAPNTSLLIGVATSTSGTQTGTALLNLASDGTGIDGLGTTTLTGQTITVTGIVDNYAAAAFQDPGGPALTGSSTNETLNLGSVVQGASALTLSLGALNTATGLSDLLQGTLSTAGAAGFTNGGFGAFSGLAAGQGEHSQSVTLSTSAAGTFTETVLLSSSGTNASGYNGTLTTETLTITGTVTPAGSTTYVLAVGPNTIVGADGGDIFQAASGALNSQDRLTGGNGNNVLQLLGGGTFDLGAPKVFSNIQTLTAYEGQSASKTLAATSQTVFLRDGTAETVNVTAGTPAGGNSTPETITLYDGNDTDSFTLATGTDTLYLGAGTDTVTLGGTKNSIVAGGGTATIAATAAFAGASVVGTSTGLTTLNLTTAGTAVLNAADTYLTVNLAASSKLTLGALGFITANGGAGADTIIGGAANQTLIGGAADVLTGYTGGTDTFLGASAALGGDTIGNWTTGDVLDLTDMNSATLKALTYAAGKSSGKLTVNDGTHTAIITFSGAGLALHNFTVIGSDGHGGTLIDFHS
jgi:hypothetical protein